MREFDKVIKPNLKLIFNDEFDQKELSDKFRSTMELISKKHGSSSEKVERIKALIDCVRGRIGFKLRVSETLSCPDQWIYDKLFSGYYRHVDNLVGNLEDNRIKYAEVNERDRYNNHEVVEMLAACLNSADAALNPKSASKLDNKAKRKWIAAYARRHGIPEVVKLRLPVEKLDEWAAGVPAMAGKSFKNLAVARDGFIEFNVINENNYKTTMGKMSRKGLGYDRFSRMTTSVNTIKTEKRLRFGWKGALMSRLNEYIFAMMKKHFRPGMERMVADIDSGNAELMAVGRGMIKGKSANKDLERARKWLAERMVGWSKGELA